MSSIHASSNDPKGPQDLALSRTPTKAARGKPSRPKKSPVVKTPNSPAGVEMIETSSPKGDVQSRIAERAYGLYHRRGGHHGQDLDDWFLAEREIVAEGSK